MVREFGGGERGVRGGAGHGFEDRGGDAEDFRAEGFGVGAPGDAEGGGGGERGACGGVWLGARGYGRGGAVGEEERVGFNVGD